MRIGGYNLPFWVLCERIQATILASDAQFASLMHLILNDFISLRTANINPPLRNIIILAENLNISLESLLNNSFDYIALAAHFVGNSFYVPERYLQGAHSKRRTAINILNYIEELYGWSYKHYLIHGHQMHENCFIDPDAPINLRFSVDICRWIKQNILDPEILENIGRHSFQTNKNSQMANELRTSRNLEELFDMMINKLIGSHVEQNFQWKIHSLNSSECVLDGIPDSNVVGVLGKNYAFDPTVCSVREGFASSIPMYLGYEAVPTKRLYCVSQGDSLIRLKLDLSANHLKRKRRLVLVEG